MNIFHKENELDTFRINDDPNDGEDILQFAISQDNIANCFGFLLKREDVEDLKKSLSNWLENH